MKTYFVLLSAVLMCTCFPLQAQRLASLYKDVDSLRLEVRKAKEPDGINQVFLHLAQAFLDGDMVDSAMHYGEKSRAGFLASGSQEGLAEAYLILQSTHKFNANYSKSMHNNFAALGLFEELGDKKGMARCYTRLCDLLYYEDNYQGGVEYCDQAIALQNKLDVPVELALSYRYRADNELQLGQYDDALTSINTALEILEEAGTSDLDLRGYWNTRGNIFKFMERYEDALAEYNRVYRITKKSDRPEGELVPSLANVGHVYTLQGKVAAAIPLTLEAIDIMKRSGNVQNLWENYMHLSNQYEAIGDLENALKYTKLFAETHVDFQYETIENLRNELQVKYETVKREETISEQETVISQQRITQFLYGGIAALLAMIAIGLLYFNNKRKARNEALSALNNELDKKNSQNELLLREIHHRVKNNLAIVQSLISLQSAKMEDSAGKDAMIASNSRVKSMGIIHQRLYQGSDLGSIEMQEYFQTLGEGLLDAYGTHERVQIDVSMDKLDLDVDTAIPIGLIVNELLTNAMKYAFPEGRKGNIDVTLKQVDEHYLDLKVSDDGVGKQIGSQGDGFGSQLVSLLCKQLKGTVEEVDGLGTVIKMRLKIRKAA